MHGLFVPDARLELPVVVDLAGIGAEVLACDLARQMIGEKVTHPEAAEEKIVLAGSGSSSTCNTPTPPD